MIEPGQPAPAFALPDHLPDYEAAGARVVGISPDPVARVKRFHDKQALTFTLLADEDHAVCGPRAAQGPAEEARRARARGARRAVVAHRRSLCCAAMPATRPGGACSEPPMPRRVLRSCLRTSVVLWRPFRGARHHPCPRQCLWHCLRTRAAPGIHGPTTTERRWVLRQLLTPILLAATALGATATAAPAAVVIEGGGFGHGIGLSQYGAYGFALRDGRDAGWIVRHYYKGTTVAKADSGRMRVLLRQSSSQTICAATRARDARGRSVTLDDARSYRLSRAGSASLRLSDARTGRSRGTLRAPVRVTGGAGVCLRGRAINGRSNGHYRGALLLHRASGGVQAVNEVAMNHYLYGVVPGEMPTSWSIEAVKAQAIVARSYAMRELRPGRSFDVYPDTRSQVYYGRGAETAAGNLAVRSTDDVVVKYGDEVAQTFFYSSSGGATANNEEVFLGGSPLPYLRSVADPHDDLSPNHTWRETIAQSTADARLGSAVRGRLRDVRVARRGPSGRVISVEVVGTGGTRTISGPELRTRLRLRSTFFSIR